MSGVFRTIDPPPPLHPASVSSPRTKGGEVHTRSAVGVKISEDARHWIGLLQYNPSTLVTLFFPRRTASLGLEPAGGPVRVPALPAAGPVPAVQPGQPAGPGRGAHAGASGAHVGVRPGRQAHTRRLTQASLPGAAERRRHVSGQDGGYVKARASPSDIETRASPSDLERHVRVSSSDIERQVLRLQIFRDTRFIFRHRKTCFVFRHRGTVFGLQT